MSKATFKLLGAAVFAVVLILLISANRSGKFEPKSYANRGKLLTVTSATVWPPGIETVALGAYVEKVYDFTVEAQAFSAEGWFWMSWSPAFQEMLAKKGLAATDVITLINLEQTTNFSVTPGSLVKLADGRSFQSFKFYGKFHAKRLDFRMFPFNDLALPIVFSVNPQIPALSADRLRLVPDKVPTGIGEYVDIPGYLLDAREISEELYEFQGPLGEIPAQTELARSFSRIKMEIFYSSSVLASLLQLFFPLLVVMAVVLLAPNLTGTLWDVRLALPSTALLTLIFLQQGYRSQLPPLPYLTFIDQVYFLCYAASLAIFALFVWSSNRLDKAGELERAAVIEDINRVDRRFQIGLTSALAILILFIWFIPIR